MKNLRWISLCVFIIFSAKNTFSQTVEFKVIDSHTEKALSGVKIEPVCIDRTAYTASSGKTTLNLGIDHCCNVKITKLGYAPETVEVCPEDNRVELYFFRNFNIKGTIKSPTGVALNRARIEFGSECGDGMRVAYTNAAGSFTFTPPAIGACCYEMIVSHPDHRKNTAVFCTTDEVHEKDIRIDYKVSDAEDFTIADVSYTTKVVSAPTEKPIVTTAAYQYVTTSNSTSTSTSNSNSNSTTTSTPYVSTPPPPPPSYSPPTVAYDTPVYTPPTIVYDSPTVSTSTYTPPSVPEYISTSAPQHVSTNKYIDPTDLSLNNVTPISANLTYFDVNQSAIRSDAYTRLDNVASFMQSNADLAVEIAVHCDSRGDYGYNQNLSERRARSVADYLVSKGITKNRLIVKGYGESQLINHCADGVPCSEMEHRQNRRALFRVTGSIYDADYTASRTYETYQPPVYAPTPSTVNSQPSTVGNPSTVPTPGVPCPDCPVKELDNEEYMDKLHEEEYFDDNFYDSDDGNN